LVAKRGGGGRKEVRNEVEGRKIKDLSLQVLPLKEVPKVESGKEQVLPY